MGVKVKVKLDGKAASDFLKTGELTPSKPSQPKIIYRHTSQPKEGAR